MRYMQCVTCKKTVQINETSTCLQCQGGFSKEKQKDVWQKKPSTLSETLEPNYEKLQQYPKLEDER